MRSILEELWYGNICSNSGCREGTKEVKELMGYIADHHDALLGMLTEINEREIFLYAFRLGMRIAIEVLTEPERQ